VYGQECKTSGDKTSDRRKCPSFAIYFPKLGGYRLQFGLDPADPDQKRANQMKGIMWVMEMPSLSAKWGTE